MELPLQTRTSVAAGTSLVHRLRLSLSGAVQGVGFRPFVYRLANEMGLKGWICNSMQGVIIEVEGLNSPVSTFLDRLQMEKPERATIQALEVVHLDAVGFKEFAIRESAASGKKSSPILPDMAVCRDCIGEVFDPRNRRYLYPFTNCTNCGPRFSIIESLPYDRPNTSMKRFEMCTMCRQEYEDPLDRRFHAQPNACPVCGPSLMLWDGDGRSVAKHHAALRMAAGIIRQGGIIALKGIGGFHLMADARKEDAVRELRQRKRREEKPLALMYPSLDSIKSDCFVSEIEERLLVSPESPIVLLERSCRAGNDGAGLSSSTIAPSVAPANPYIGAMLPYTPLHCLLMDELRFPVVATSGNISDEPICTDEYEALERLRRIADFFLVHNRPIVRHVDDSIVRVIMGREMVVRRARGLAPLPVHMGTNADSSILAVGAQLKNAVALSVGGDVFISQHIGDLETKEACAAFQKVTTDLQELYDARPGLVVCDMHPDYISTEKARNVGVPTMAVQHHYAHIVSCMAENDLQGEVLGVAWDGSGYGDDGTIWGGEFLLTIDNGFERVATFRPFRLPGGERAIKEPRRTALGILYEVFGDSPFGHDNLATFSAFAPYEVEIIHRMLRKGVNSPSTTSVGRLFDGVGSLVGLRQITRFEGQAAMELEFAVPREMIDHCYSVEIEDGSSLIVDWRPMVREILDDIQSGCPVGRVAAKFHNTLVEMILLIAARVGQKRIVLSGGCFQNKYLTERAIQRLKCEGYFPYWHQRVPPNDGGIALGQVYAAVERGRRNYSGHTPKGKTPEEMFQ